MTSLEEYRSKTLIIFAAGLRVTTICVLYNTDTRGGCDHLYIYIYIYI